MRFGLLRWFGGLAAAMAVWAGASLYLQTTVEADLIAGARDALGSVAQSWAKVTVRGRDVEIEGEAPSSADKQRVFAALKRVAGVRLIRDATTVLPDGNRRTKFPAGVVPRTLADPRRTGGRERAADDLARR